MQLPRRIQPTPRKSKNPSSKFEIRNPDFQPRMKHGQNTEKNPCFIRVSSVARFFCFALIMLALAPVWADEPTHDQQIVEIQKQIQQLNKKLEDLKQTKSNDPAAPPGAISPDWIKTMTWRCIGPAAMSGRIIAISVNEADPST